MISPIKYIASSGKEYDLVSNGVVHCSANYYDWHWSAVGTVLQYGVRIANFSKQPAEYDVELFIYGTPEARKRLLTALHEDFENDLRNKTPGRLVWGDHYIDCYVTQSQSSPAQTWDYISNKIHIYAPYPFWVQEHKVSLPVSQETQSTYLDYTYDYTYDYAAPTVGTKVVKSDFAFDSEFQMIIYGPAVNPRVTINDYPYVLYATIPQGAYVVIDSKTKSITQHNTNGTTSNLFNFRNKATSIFQKIPGGDLSITWDASFGVDITIFREKSEPDFEEVVE